MKISSKIVGILFYAVLFSSLGLAQQRVALTINQISDLLKGRVSSNRIVQLLEQQGVSFELNDPALRRLRADGADDVVLAAVRKMALRYADEQRRNRSTEIDRQKSGDAGRQDEETAQRGEEIRRQLQANARRLEKQKKPGDRKQADSAVAQESREAARKVGESSGKARAENSQRANGAALMSQADAGRVASLRNVINSERGEVSGSVVNNSSQTLRDVQVQIVYSWRWNNEFQPGKDDPGTARYYTLNQEIPPGQTITFDYKPSPPLATRNDGQFDVTVKVVGFAQVFQPATR